jgi:hypothetical protein
MLTSRLLIAKGTLRQKGQTWQIERPETIRSPTRNPATLETCASLQLFSCVRTQNSFKCCAQELTITEHRDFDSSSGGCSTPRLSACPVSTKRSRCSTLVLTHFNLLKDVECSPASLGCRSLSAAVFGPLGESGRDHPLIPPDSLPSGNRYLQY